MGIFALGIVVAYSGWALLPSGLFAYHNHYRAVVYSPELIVFGGVIMLVAIVPDSLVGAMLKRSKGNGIRSPKRRAGTSKRT